MNAEPYRAHEAAEAPRDRLWWSGVVFLVAFTIHTTDHLRRGADSITATLYVAGTISSAISVAAITLVLSRHRLAPAVAAAVGFPQAVAFFAAHLLPRWSELSDSFPDQDVSWFSWFAAGAEISGAAWLGVCGLLVLRRDGITSILARPGVG